MASTAAKSTRSLKLALITGTTRTSGPPYPVNGLGVNKFIEAVLKQRGHSVVRIDPHDFELLNKPHFVYAPGDVPSKMKDAHTALKEADGFVCVTPEYNHAPSPGLLNVLDHFGSSIFSFKPSAIVSYSAGQWGGTRAAVVLRSTLSELGCLPVSAMIHIPKAQEVFEENGSVKIENNQDPERWQKYCDRCFSQLEWWGEAASRHKQIVDPFAK